MTFEAEVTQIKIKEMLGGSFFSICDVDEIGDMIGVNPRQHPNYIFLKALHCVHFNKMSAAVRQELPHKIIECLRPEMSAELVARALLIEGSQFVNIEDDGNLLEFKK